MTQLLTSPPRKRPASLAAARKAAAQPGLEAEGQAELTHEQIARHAYHIWQHKGRPAGMALQHWLQAEADLRNIIAWGREPD